jgi:hypothetical protein
MAPLHTFPDALPETSGMDSAPIRWAPWLTSRRLMLFVIGWLVLFAVIGVFVSNPFQSETSAGATPDYAKVMFLHGLLIGMVGLLALLTCQVLALRSLHVRLWVAGGVVVATILAAVGGIWDRTIPGSEVPMWTQILGFFALDEILIVLLYGLITEWRTARTARTLPYVAAMIATVSMFAAAIMGHLAGWIMEFGNFPKALGEYASFAGIGTVADFAGALVGSHSHEMAMGVMALTITLVAQQFGYPRLTSAARVLAQIGVGVVAVGTVVMTLMYVASGFSAWAPPTWFESGPGLANGIASDDVITGILVMGGGLLIIVALLLGRPHLVRQPLRLAAIWAWVLSFATVVVAGYAIELNEVYFGAGDPTTAGAAKDAVFTWLHQDIGLFLLPALVLVMLAAEWLIDRDHPGWIGWTTIVGSTVAFLGSMVYVFVDPAMYGAGYVISTIGLLGVGAALLATLWWGTLRAMRSAVPPAVPGPSALSRTAPLWQVLARPERPAPPASPTPHEPALPERPEREATPVGEDR